MIFLLSLLKKFISAMTELKTADGSVDRNIVPSIILKPKVIKDNDKPNIIMNSATEQSNTVTATDGNLEGPKEIMNKVLITEKQFMKLFPKGIIELVPELNKLLIKNNIDTLERVVCFLAQCGHESAEFRTFKENLNYSAAALQSVFGKYFSSSKADRYARNPEMIANRVYANRMGNGSEESGDGWRYRGRGLIQLTGKENYQKFSDFCGKSLDDTIKFCEEFEGIVLSAVFFWTITKCNDYADANDFTGLTKKINGGTNGITHREELYVKIKKEISENFK